MRHRIVRAVSRAALFVAAWILGDLDPAPARAESLLWPLELESRAITGTFMEPRSAHYHSGLDIRTAARTGLRVRAPGDGSVVRLRTSPHGYGLAIYLQLNDGRTLVFAHMGHFADRLQPYVTRAWAARGVYKQDIRIPVGELEVTRGELLGLSGASGVGAPHLHLEVRDSRERPLNPLLEGFEVPDGEAPRVLGLRLVPLGEAARLDGGARAAELEDGQQIEAVGPVGVQVRVRDTTGLSRHTLMPFGLEARLDGDVVYRLEQRRFAFSQSAQMRLEVEPDPDQPRRQRWVRLYRREGNDLPHRYPESSGPTLELGSDGLRRRLQVVAWDAAGRRDSVSVFLQSPQPAAPSVRVRAGASDPMWSLEITPGETVVELRALADERMAPGREASVRLRVWPALGRPPRLLAPELLSDGSGVVTAVDYQALGSGMSVIEVLDGNSPVAQSALELAVVGDVPSARLFHGRVHVDGLQSSNVFPGGGLWVRDGDENVEIPDGTQLIGRPVVLMGAGVSLRRSLDVSLALPATADPGPLGLFHRDTKGEWECVGQVEGGRVSGSVKGLGPLAVLRDAQPPFLGSFQSGSRKLKAPSATLRARPAGSRYNGVTQPRWPAVELPLVDAGAGLEEEGIVATVNGSRYPVRWDPEEERVFFDWYVDPGPGEHELSVVATDELGNRAEESLRVKFVPEESR